MGKNQGLHPILGWLLVLAVLLLAAPALRAQVQFAPPVAYPVGADPVAVVVGDLNGDGKADLAVANNGANDVSILLGNGDGTFQPAVSYPAGLTPTSMAEGDFNGDGKMDLVVANGSANSVSILLGNGDGTFQAPVQYVTGAYSASYVAVGDFNGDQKLDLYVSDGSASPAASIGPLHVNVLLGNGDGTFQPAVETTVQGGAPISPPHINPFAALGDFNGDGYLDVALSEYWGTAAAGNFGGSLLILLGNGDGTFQQPTYYSFGPYDDALVTWGVVAGDFNGDGNIDLASSAMTGIWVWLGQGDGTFNFTPNPANGYGSYGGLFKAAADADLNNDGNLDIVALGGSVTYNAIEWGLGNGSGTFQGLPMNNPACTAVASCMALPASYTDTDLIYPLVLVDLNGDHLPDIVMTEGGENSVNIFLNDTNTPSFPLNLTMTGVVLGTTGGVVTSQPLGLLCLVSCVATFPSGTTVTLTETPDAESVFAGWGGACSGVGTTCTVTMNAAQSVTANFNFTTQLSVSLAGSGSGTVTSSPSGINCGAACSAGYNAGTVVTLTATPNSSSNFSGWSGACSGTSGCSMTMNGNESVTATFVAQDFSLTPASATLTVQAGGQATDVMTIGGVNGSFGSAVQLSCTTTGPAPMPTCTLTPGSVTPGAGSATSTLTVSASQSGALLAPSQSEMFVRAVWLPAMFGIVVVVRPKKRQRSRLICGILLAFLLIGVACGGGKSNAGNQPMNYTVTVTGTSGAVQHSTQVAVTVQ